MKLSLMLLRSLLESSLDLFEIAIVEILLGLLSQAIKMYPSLRDAIIQNWVTILFRLEKRASFAFALFFFVFSFLTQPGSSRSIVLCIKALGFMLDHVSQLFGNETRNITFQVNANGNRIVAAGTVDELFDRLFDSYTRGKFALLLRNSAEILGRFRFRQRIFARAHLFHQR
jgi:hypothetical protein